MEIGGENGNGNGNETGVEKEQITLNHLKFKIICHHHHHIVGIVYARRGECAAVTFHQRSTFVPNIFYGYLRNMQISETIKSERTHVSVII